LTLIDKYTILLFSPFERDVGTPARQRIHTMRDFVKFIEQNNGRTDCYAEVYAFPYTTIDKVFLDFDGPSAVKEAQQVYTYLKAKRIPVIPVASGKKGIHLHVMIKPQTFTTHDEAKTALTMITWSLLSEFSSLTSLDTHVIGDVRRFCRIPNTLRPPENVNWCVFLPENWDTMTELDIIRYIKAPHAVNYNLPPRQEVKPTTSTNRQRQTSGQMTVQTMIPAQSHEFLQRILRPCLYNAICQPNPRHHVRVAATVDLKNAGLPFSFVERLYSTLKWIDYDPNITHYQITQIYKSNYSSYSCKRLQELGICDGRHQ
jgi:hypothetical protein